jgi:hypothetical protein
MFCFEFFGLLSHTFMFYYIRLAQHFSLQRRLAINNGYDYKNGQCDGMWQNFFQERRIHNDIRINPAK